MAALNKKISIILATGFGLGFLLPMGQGTLAALVFIFAVPWFLEMPLLWQIVSTVLATFGGMYFSTVAEKILGKKDDHRIVIDEIVSIFITFLGFSAGIGFWWLAAGLVLNRVLDWWKPFPANKLQNLSGGWGVMLDDVVSGIYANLLLRLAVLLSAYAGIYL